MTQLHEIIAIEKGAKSTTERDITQQYQALQKDALFGGITRTYDPKDEDGDRLPSEGTKVQLNVESILVNVAAALTRLFDVTLTKEVANTQAKADIEIDGATLATDVPVTYLLSLEKELVHLRTIVAKLPLLDPAENWSHDGTSGVWVSEEKVTTRTNKVPRAIVLYDATDKHPAQVEKVSEDKLVGYWTTKTFSGRIPQERREVLVRRVDKLIDAVRTARQRANTITVTDRHIGADIFSYLLA